MIQVLNEREFPVGELRLLASGRSAGRTRRRRRPDPSRSARRRRRRSTASTSPSSRPAPTSRSELAPGRRGPRRDGHRQLVARGGWTRRSRSSSRQVNPDDLEGHEGIIANPNCSTMQLVPVLMALRDTVGLERVVVDTYQSVSGTGADALAELEGQIRAHVAGEPKQATVYPHPIAFNALPEIDVFLDERLHEGGVEGRHREPQDPRTCRTCASRARPSASRSSSATPRRSTSRRASRSRPERARELFAAVPGVVVQDDPADHDYPLATEAAGRDEIFVGRVRRDASIAGRPRPRLLGRLATTCARARRRTPSSSPRCSSSATGSRPRRRVERRAYRGRRSVVEATA